MTMKKQQRYTPEFRAEAVKLVSTQGISQETAAKRLAIPKGTLANWVAASKASPPTHRHLERVQLRSWRPRMPGYARSWLRPAWSVTS
jgi:transposase-like protein